MNHDINKNTGCRMYFMDNLRTFMIFLVIFLHTGLIYESSGITAAWWIIDDPATNNLSGIFNIIIDIIVMPAIFFISGFFTPLSLHKTKGGLFLLSRSKRLMLPWAIAVIVLIPAYKVIFLYSRNLPQENWTTYFHWRNGIWSQNWLWFLPVLFIFNIIYFILSRFKLDAIWFTFKRSTGLVFIIAVIYSFSMSFYNMTGWTKTPIIDFQNERLLIYFIAFLLGISCHNHNLLSHRVKSKKLFYFVSGTIWIPINLYILLIIHSLIKPGIFIFSHIIDLLIFSIAFNLSLLGLLYLLISFFRYYLNGKGNIWQEINKSSYGVYIIHTIVMGWLALLLLNIAIPSFLKHVLVAVLTFIISSMLVILYRKFLKHCRLFILNNQEEIK